MAITYDSTRTGQAHDGDESRIATLESANLVNRVTLLENSSLDSRLTTIENANLLNRVSALEYAYIVERGTAAGTVHGTGQSMTWNYIKWSNGIAMCHGIAESTRGAAGAGQVYYCSGSDPYWDFPSGLFISAPSCTASICYTSTNLWPWMAVGGECTKTKTQTLMFFGYKTFDSVTVRFAIQAWGYWK